MYGYSQSNKLNQPIRISLEAPKSGSRQAQWMMALVATREADYFRLRNNV